MITFMISYMAKGKDKYERERTKEQKKEKYE